MALATTCPRCQTGFRVVPDQLKIRRGLVRCGHCRHVFSGLDSLRYVNETTVASFRPVPASETSLAIERAAAGAEPAAPPADSAAAARSRPAEAPPRSADPEDDHPATLLVPEPTDDPTPATRRPPAKSDELMLEGLDDLDDLGALSRAAAETRATTVSPLAGHPETYRDDGHPGLEDAAAARTGADDAAPTHAQGVVEPPPPPEDPSAAWSAAVLAQGPEERRMAAAGASTEAVDFFAPPSRAGGFTSRGNAIAALACAVLGVILAVQLAVVGRDWLAAHVPGAETALGSAAQALGIDVAAPRRLEALTLESFDVHAGTGPRSLVLNALLRNQAPHRVLWPSMELTLTDGAGVVVVRKVLAPGDYVPAERMAAGVPPERELPLQVALETAGIHPSGYNVKLFYP